MVSSPQPQATRHRRPGGEAAGTQGWRSQPRIRLELLPSLYPHPSLCPSRKLVLVTDASSLHILHLSFSLSIPTLTVVSRYTAACLPRAPPHSGPSLPTPPSPEPGQPHAKTRLPPRGDDCQPSPTTPCVAPSHSSPPPSGPQRSASTRPRQHSARTGRSHGASQFTLLGHVCDVSPSRGIAGSSGSCDPARGPHHSAFSPLARSLTTAGTAEQDPSTSSSSR